MSKRVPTDLISAPGRHARDEVSAAESRLLESWFRSERIDDPVLADASLRRLAMLSLRDFSPRLDFAAETANLAWREQMATPAEPVEQGTLRWRLWRQIESAIAHPICRAATGVTLFVTSLGFAVALVTLAQAFAGTTPQELLVRSSGFAATFVEMLTLLALFVGLVVDSIGEVVSIASGPEGLAFATSLTVVLACGLLVAIRNAPRTTVRVRD